MFHLGVGDSDSPGDVGSTKEYLYDDILYRRWITDIALAFYQGRQDTFVYEDFIEQFMNPEKQQIFTIPLTSEIVDEASILYSEPPKYRVIYEKTGNISKKDQALWEEIMADCNYHNLLDHLDKFTRLLGTVLVKISFVDETTGYPLSSGKKGKPRLQLVWNGYYDVNISSSPHFINKLLMGMDNDFSGLDRSPLMISKTGEIDTDAMGQFEIVNSPPETPKEVYWSLTEHATITKDNELFIEENPYGLIPAVAFFNKEPVDYFYLPVDEPLLYANHAINMRLSDLNHIAKFQSFGVPVMKGARRSTSLRRGRPVDDYNELKAGGASSTFPGFTRRYSQYDNIPGFNDGNVDAAALGMVIGPDTAIATGESGDFKFASPNADIRGLSETIMHMADWMRISHGLKPKFKPADGKGASGYSLMMEKIGVIEDNIRRAKLFKYLEQQVFKKMVVMWNIHHKDRQFSKNLRLEIDYVEPNFPIDPQTRFVLVGHQQQIVESGDRRAIKEIFKDKTDKEIEQIIRQYQKDREEQLERNLKLIKIRSEFYKENEIAVVSEDSQINSYTEDKTKNVISNEGTGKVNDKKAKVPIDNRVEHSKQSANQPKGPIPKRNR